MNFDFDMDMDMDMGDLVIIALSLKQGYTPIKGGVAVMGVWNGYCCQAVVGSLLTFDLTCSMFANTPRLV